ncbi:acyl-CoA synthetase [Azospirillum sp.]|uniref:acyl-CoA synthetase n=1 Tax=Azospirillum sp. TaxID=34012 RepID=UPI002D6EF1BB|nr:acyl-CoA synthetase [Azospirillum sp.]HYD70083.1 acyl-CoA synthetase [Azospirillum sp.]
MPDADPLIRRNTIGDALRRCTRRWRDKPAILYGDRRWTFAELEQAAGRVAHGLLAAGFAVGDRIAAYGRNSDTYLLLWLACARAGLIHVPVNFGLTGEELRFILEQSGAAAVIADPEMEGELHVLDQLPRPVRRGRFEGGGEIDVLALARDGGLPGDGVWPVAEGDIAQIIYTSGTTGLPKGVAMSHDALMTHYQSCIHECDFSGRDRVLSALPLYHAGQMHVFTMPSLLVGSTATLIRGPEPPVVLRLIESERIDSFFAPPTVWVSLLRHPDFGTRDLGCLRNVYYGASIMPVPVVQELRRRLPGVQFYNCYGQSEVGPLATLLRPEEHDARPASAGRPVLNVETRIVDEAMNDVAPGVVGEIVHRSPHLLTEYWNNPEATAEAFAGGWFHSGDLGYMDEEGYLFIVDRIKDVINTGGVLVASREVEDALFEHPAVSEVAVIGLPDAKWIEAVTAVVVLRPGQTASEEELIADCRRRLAYYKVPKRVIFAAEFPRNASGKILKRTLRKTYGGTEAAFLTGETPPDA